MFPSREMRSRQMTCRFFVKLLRYLQVKTVRLLVSILLLLSFGVALGSEALQDAEHAIVCQGEEFSPSDESVSSGATYLQPCHAQDQHEGPARKCTDPCHTGKCHFGHCSFPITDANLRYPLFELSESKHLFSEIMIEAPTLEGPRRPPRHI